MKRVLLTGMSGTGKSSVVQELVARGYKAVDTDDGFCDVQPDGRQLWREDAIQQLLATEDADVLFVAGCEENQGTFHPQFDHIVLLSAPLETMVERLQTRTNNPYGKSPARAQPLPRGRRDGRAAAAPRGRSRGADDRAAGRRRRHDPASRRR